MRYLVSGYYGEKNAGDEAILAGILQELELRDPEAAFTVLSFDPEDTERRHSVPGRGLRAMSTSLRDPKALKAVMKEADLLISGGGSFLHEADFELHGRSFLLREGKLRPIPYFLSVVLMARGLRLPVIWYAQGLGPLHTRAARRLVAAAASASQAVTWRDPGSARLAYEIGVRAPIQAVVPDPAYALAPAEAGEAREVLSAAGVERSRRFIAVCPRPWLGRTGYVDSLGRALEEVADSADVDIVCVPFHETQDLEVCETVVARPALAGRAHVLPPVSSPALLSGVLAAADLVVAMRLHSGILSASAGTPAVVVDYDPKTRAFAAQTRQTPWMVSVDMLEAAPSAAAPLTALSAAAPPAAPLTPPSAAPSAAPLTPQSPAPPAAPLAGQPAAPLAAAILDTLADLPGRRAALRAAVAPLITEAGRTAQLAVQLAAGRGRLPSRPQSGSPAFSTQPARRGE